MPPKAPSLRLHRPTGQAVVTLRDITTGRRRDYYCGVHGTPAAVAEYARLIQEWEGRGRTLDAKPKPPTPRRTADAKHGTVAKLAIAYVKHLRDRGTTDQQLTCIRAAIRVLRSTHGGTPVIEFGPLALQEVRTAMIDLRNRRTEARPEGKRWTRSTINRRVRHLIRMFRWAVANEKAPTALPEALACVEPLKAGEFGVPEGRTVKPVPVAHIEGIKAHVAPQVWAMIQAQRYTAARAGEVCAMRAIDIDMTGEVWLYRPQQHKNSHRGHDRVIYLGRKAQQAVTPLLAGRAVDAYLFDPREATAARRATAATKGKPRRAGQKPTPTRTARKIADHYTSASYGRAITRACDVAGVPRWGSHQLRHLAATNARKEFGAEAALLLLGDKSTRLVDIYAEKDVETVKAVVGKIG
ncbi:MAG: site-specific integrase [Planctomycetota bacterium]